MNILIKYGSWPVIILPYCVFILSPNMYQFATPWKMVTCLKPSSTRPLHVFVLCRAFIRRLFFLSFTLFD